MPTIGQLLQLHVDDAGLSYAVAEVHRKFKDDPLLNQGPLALLRYNFAQCVVFDNQTSERYRTGYLNDTGGETSAEERKRAYHNYNRTKNLKGKKLDESILKKARKYYKESDVFVAEACQEGAHQRVGPHRHHDP